MKKFLSFITTLSIFITSSSYGNSFFGKSSEACHKRWYLQIYGGSGILHTNGDWKVPLSFAIGYRLIESKPIFLEGEFLPTYETYMSDGMRWYLFGLRGSRVRYHHLTNAFITNLILEVPNKTCLTPFIGFGGGISSFHDLGNKWACNGYNSFAQLKVGVIYRINQKFDVGSEVKHIFKNSHAELLRLFLRYKF